MITSRFLGEEMAHLSEMGRGVAQMYFGWSEGLETRMWKQGWKAMVSKYGLPTGIIEAS